MNLCIGRIPFLVCAPFFYKFLGKETGCPGYRFVDGAPSALNELLKEGRIHLAPASSIGYALHPGDFVLAPRLCTSCNLEVRSVKLFSSCPLELLSSRRIHLTSQSATSVALVKILMALYIEIQPEYVSGSVYDSSFDARLLIGDEALLEDAAGHFEYNYDLASLWRDWQGLPFVFGAWSIHRSALVPELRPLLDRFLSEAERSVFHFREHQDRALDAWLAAYPVNLPRSVMEDYYDVLDYSFTEERKRSLSLFFALCHKMGFIEKNPQLVFLQS